MNIKDFTEVFNFIEKECPSIKITDAQVIEVYAKFKEWDKRKREIGQCLKKLTCKERLEVINRYCLGCGAENPCYCMREK